MNKPERQSISPDLIKAADKVGKFTLGDIIEPIDNPNYEQWEIFGTDRIRNAIDVLKLGLKHPYPIVRKIISLEEQEKWKKVNK